MARERFASGEVTAATVMSEVSGARRDLADMLGEIKVIKAQNNATVAALADHETRLRGTERWQWKAAGTVAVVALVASGLFGYLWAALLHAHP